jgi:hypothetical protein
MRQHVETLLSILFWVALGGAIVWLSGVGNQKETDKAQRAAQTTQAKEKQVQAALQAGPTVVKWETPEGTLLSLAIPRQGVISSFLDVQKCIVWRDGATGAALLHCDKAGMDLDTLRDHEPSRADME